MLKIGLIGAGRWGKNYIKTISKMKQAQLIWVCTKNSNIFNESAYKEIDCVIIATPSDTHYFIAKDALLHNKHVLCEKPLTKNLKETEELISLAHEQNKVLMVGHEYLYHSGIIALKKIIQHSELGKINYLVFERKGMHENVDDVLWEVGPHDIYTSMFLLKDNDLKIENYEGDKHNYSIVLKSVKSDTRIFISISSNYPEKIRKLKVVGDKLLAYFDEKSLRITELDDTLIKEIPHSKKSPLENQCNLFFNAINYKKHYVALNQESAVNTIRMLEKLSK